MNYELFLHTCDEKVSKATSPQINSSDGYIKMKKISGNEAYLIREKLIYLRKKIIYEHFVNEMPLHPYLSYVNVLLDGIRDNTKTMEQGNYSSIKWDDIISVLGEIKETNTLIKSSTNYEDVYAKEFDFSRSCARIIIKGFPIIEKEDKFYFDQNYHHQLTLEIERLSVSVGGCNILHTVFECISNSFDSSQQRFHTFRSLSTGGNRPLPAIPWAYLIALGAKHSNSLGDSKNGDNIKELIELLTDLLSIFELQDYTPYGSWYVDHHHLSEFISDGVVFDNLFCIAQTHSGYVIELLDYLVNSDEFRSVRSHGFLIGKIYDCGLALLNKSLEQQITDIDFNVVKQSLNLGTKKALVMINNLLLNKTPNESLKFPPRSTDIDNNFTQLIPFKERYILLPRSLSSLAFLNSTLNAIIAPDGKRNNNNDAMLGHLIERFIKDKLEHYGIVYRSGNFSSKDGLVSGESDLTIETENSIIFIEIKKKGMTRLSMSGVDYSIFSDLGGGLIHATSQCFKAERILRCDGEINIEGSSPLIYKSQRIFKIALTLYDYGIFQDRMTLRSILNNSLGATFKGSDASIDKKLDNWNGHIKELSEHIQELDHFGQLDREPFHSLFFMSIPQLLMILDDNSSSEGIDRVLRTLSSISYSTRDFYKEYSLSRKLMQS